VTLSSAPRLLKAGLVLVDPASGAVQRIVSLQYNPDSLSRSLQVQAYGGDGRDRSEALRLKGPPVETIRLEAELDAADALERPDEHPAAVAYGVHPQLAALASLVQPSSAQLEANAALAAAGTLEIVPMQAPLALFVWSRSRVVPVRVTELSVTEEAFDPALNPIRARVTLGLRVLTVDDLGFSHRGGSLFLAYLRGQEALARRVGEAGLATLGLEGLP
jgi:hypothetical protein